ncbi:MAG: DUF4390 domain-containing protein [Burkholderiales bacterium]|jgi:uncharacterized membrane protein YqaE (UPF0057 family)|nr:DUF4390 domain-containing protein [Burkholderiales bacterium]
MTFFLSSVFAPVIGRGLRRGFGLRVIVNGVVVLLAWSLAFAVFAETIPLRSAELRVEEDSVVFNADYGLSLTPSLEEAVERGVPLYFVFEWKVTYPRWYWFDKTVLTGSTQHRLSYLPLTRQYRLSTGLLSQDVASIEEAERLIGRINSRPLFDRNALEEGQRYTFAVRLRLDTERMPKPFQITALGSRDWNLASSWLTLDFRP